MEEIKGDRESNIHNATAIQQEDDKDDYSS